MRLSGFEAHLSYCMNVHPAASFADVRDNLANYAAEVGRRTSPDAPFGVGLWLPASALADLRADPTPLRESLAAHNLYLFTVNGFPYGPFHDTAVKTKVYHPDWATEQRYAYTAALVDVLAALLPPGVPGSISTVPVTYGKTLPDGAMANLARIAAYVRETNARHHTQIAIALEPEPDCYLETTAETIAFFQLLRTAHPEIGAELGVCFDTCHVSLQAEDLPTAWRRLQEAKIAIPKVQLSAALTCDNRAGAARDALGAFAEPVYLHQTRVLDDAGAIARRFPDLQPALDANLPGEWLVHYHVPLPYVGDGVLGSTAHSLTPAFLQTIAAACPNVEVETYTFNILPDPKPDVVTSICNELAWVRRRLHV